MGGVGEGRGGFRVFVGYSFGRFGGVRLGSEFSIVLGISCFALWFLVYLRCFRRIVFEKGWVAVFRVSLVDVGFVLGLVGF